MSLIDQALAYNREIKAALETIFAELTRGQRQKLLKNEAVRAMVERFGLEVETNVK